VFGRTKQKTSRAASLKGANWCWKSRGSAAGAVAAAGECKEAPSGWSRTEWPVRPLPKSLRAIVALVPEQVLEEELTSGW